MFAVLLRRGTLHRARRVIEKAAFALERDFGNGSVENATLIQPLVSLSFFVDSLRVDEVKPNRNIVELSLFRVKFFFRSDRSFFLEFLEGELENSKRLLRETSNPSNQNFAFTNNCDSSGCSSLRDFLRWKKDCRPFVSFEIDDDIACGCVGDIYRSAHDFVRSFEDLLFDRTRHLIAADAECCREKIEQRFGFSYCTLASQDMTSNVVLRDFDDGHLHSIFLSVRTRFVAAKRAELERRQLDVKPRYFEVRASPDTVVQPNLENAALDIASEKDVREYTKTAKQLFGGRRKGLNFLDSVAGDSVSSSTTTREKKKTSRNTIRVNLNSQQQFVVTRVLDAITVSDDTEEMSLLKNAKVIFVNSDAGTGKSIVAAAIENELMTKEKTVLYALPTHRLRSKVASRSCTIDALLRRVLVTQTNARVSPGELWRFIVDDFDGALDRIAFLRRDQVDSNMKRRIKSSVANVPRNNDGEPSSTDEVLGRPIDTEETAAAESSSAVDFAPDVIIIDEAAMCDWRKLYLVREICRRLRCGLVFFGDSCQNAPLYGDPNNAENIALFCCDEMYQLSRNVRSGDDERCERLLAHFRSGLNGRALRSALALTLPSNVYANGTVDCNNTIRDWSRKLSLWVKNGGNGRTFPPKLLLPRLMSLSNRRVDRLNHALQSLIVRNIRESIIDIGERKSICLLSRRVLVAPSSSFVNECANTSTTFFGVSSSSNSSSSSSLNSSQSFAEDAFDESCCNEVLLIAGAPYRFIGESFGDARTSLTRDCPVTLVAVERSTDRVAVLADTNRARNLIWLYRDTYQERRMSNRRNGERFFGFPLVLDAAVTQFKAQGETFDRASYPTVYVDATNMDDKSLYVALSRVENYDQFCGFVGLI